MSFYQLLCLLDPLLFVSMNSLEAYFKLDLNHFKCFSNCKNCMDYSDKAKQYITDVIITFSLTAVLRDIINIREETCYTSENSEYMIWPKRK